MLNRLLTWLGFKSGIPGIEPIDGRLREVARRLVTGDVPDAWHPLSSSAQARVARGEWCDQTVVLKVFLPRGRLELVKSLGRGSRGVRAARRGRDLCAEGFDAPQVLAHGWADRFEILVMTEISAESLSRLISSRLGPPLSGVSERQAIHRAFAHRVAAMHQAGWAHGDLRLGNVLLSNPETQQGFVFLDNEGCLRSRKEQELRRNLIQLNMMRPQYLPKTARLRFLRHYVAKRGWEARTCHDLARLIGEATAKRRARRERRGGPRPRHMVDD